jgi:pantothenate kinase-related protein Tda10
MEQEVALVVIPIAFAWVGWISNKVASHSAVIDKLDTLVDLLLEERLNAKGENWRQAEESRDSRGSY